MARDEKIIITKYHGHCVASFCGRCLQRFSDKYDKSCEGTNKKCLFYNETGLPKEQVIDIIENAISGKKTNREKAESVLEALLDKRNSLSEK